MKDVGIENLDPKTQSLAEAFVDTWKTSIRPELRKYNMGYLLITIYPDDDPTNTPRRSGGTAAGIFTNINMEDQEQVLQSVIEQVNTPEYKAQALVRVRDA